MELGARDKHKSLGWQKNIEGVKSKTYRQFVKETNFSRNKARGMQGKQVREWQNMNNLKIVLSKTKFSLWLFLNFEFLYSEL
jgi:hypothetical protein